MVRLEVCVDNPDGIAAAVAGGADRLELCSALDLGGLTPGPGLMALAARTGVPVIALIRPRAGDFCWSADDMDAALNDIAGAQRAGLAGVAIGASLADGTLDAASIARLRDAADGMEVALFRAIDVAPDPAKAVRTAAKLGIRRILSSGGAPSAVEGIDTLRAIMRAAPVGMSIMPGAGVTPANVGRILAETGARDIHASCSRVLQQTWHGRELGFSATTFRRTDAELVRAMKAAIGALPSTDAVPT